MFWLFSILGSALVVGFALSQGLTASPTGAAFDAPPEVPGLKHEYLQDVAVMAWNHGKLVTDTHDMAPGFDLTVLPSQGFVTVNVQVEGLSPLWRTYSVQAGEGALHRRVVVLMDMRQRYELGKDIAEHVAQPAVLVLPHYLMFAEEVGVLAHMTAICKSVGIGVVYYARDNTRLSPANLEKLAEACPNFIGYKDGIGDVQLMQRISHRLGDRLRHVHVPLLAQHVRVEPHVSGFQVVVELLAQPLLDVKAVGGRNILKVDAAKRGRQNLDGLNKLVGVFGVELEVKYVDASKFFEEDSFSFHNRLRCLRPNIA